MLTDYLRAAMRRATYEVLPDAGTFFGSIPSCPGAWANATTMEACREELAEVLDGWLFIKLRHGDTDFAMLDGIDLNQPAFDPPHAQEVA